MTGFLAPSGATTTKDDDRASLAIVTTALRLSDAVERMMRRFPETARPSKQALLNDLAEALRPGANWGGLLAAAREARARNERSAMPPDDPARAARLVEIEAALSRLKRSSTSIEVRLTEIACKTDEEPLALIADDLHAVFGAEVEWAGPIAAIVFRVDEGNGYHETSVQFDVLVLTEAGLIKADAAPADLPADVARAILNAIQCLDLAGLGPVIGQYGGAPINLMIGAPRLAIATVRPWRGERINSAATRPRMLIDPADPPDTADYARALDLLSAAAVHLGMAAEGDVPPRFSLSAPRSVDWTPVDLATPPDLGPHRYPVRQKDGSWSNDLEPLHKANVGEPYRVDRAIDLALAVVNVDDPAICFLGAFTAPRGKRTAPRDTTRPGWRGVIARDWRLVKFDPARGALALRLDPGTETQLRRGVNAWLTREGYRVIEARAKSAIEMLVLRDQRRSRDKVAEMAALIGPEAKDDAS